MQQKHLAKSSNKMKIDIKSALPQFILDAQIKSKQESDQISHNIEAVLDFYTSEEQKTSSSQRTLEKISGFIGQPIFLGIISYL